MNLFGFPLGYVLRSVWARRTTSLATAVGIALVVFVLASSLMLAAGLRRTLISAGSPNTAIVLQVDGFSEGGSRLTQAALGQVSAAPGIAVVDGKTLIAGESVVHVYLEQVDNAAQHASVQVRGITDVAFPLRPEVRIVEGRRPKPGTNEAIVGRALVGDFKGLAIGEGFELQKNRPLSIVGVFEANRSALESEVWADLDTVRSAFGAQGYLSSVTAQLESEQHFDAFKLAVEQDERRGLLAERETDYYAKVSNNLARVISGLGGIVTFIFSFGAVLGAMITMHAAVSQRRREMGVMRALGFQRRHVLGIVVAESLSVALLGGALGAALALLTPLVEISTVNWATGQELEFSFLPSLSTLAIALLSGTAVGVLGGLFPAIRAARLDPVTAIRGG